MPIFSYNGLEIPYNQVFDKFSFSQKYEEAEFSCKFLAVAATEDDLITVCDEIESKFSEWNQDFVLKFGDNATEEYNFSHSANTGFLARPKITKITNEFSTGLCRPYTFHCTFKLPATQTGYDYRQSSQIYFYTPKQDRRTVVISGVYTAGGGNTAQQNYNTYGVAYGNSVALSFFGVGDYEKINEDIDYDQENKLLNFKLTYQEDLDLVIIYNGYTITGKYYKWSHNVAYTSSQVSLDFEIAKADELVAIAALKIKDAALTITVGTNTVSYDPVTNSGFLSQPKLRKLDDRSDDQTTSFYNFTVDYQLPAEKVGDDFRNTASFTVGYDATRRRRVTFNTAYTAGGLKTALENYNDASTGGKKWAESILAILGFTVGGASQNYDIISENVNEEHREKICTGTFVVQEILSPETEAAINDVDIVSASVNYAIQLENQVGASFTRDYAALQIPGVTISLTYTLQINRDTVAADTSMEAVYRTKVKPWILKHSINVLNLAALDYAGSPLIIQRENYTAVATNYTFNGTLQALAPQSQNQIIRYTELLQRRTNEGKTFVKIWDGIPHTYSAWGIGTQEYWTRSTTITQLGALPLTPAPYLTGTLERLSVVRKDSVVVIGSGSNIAIPQVTEALLFTTNFVEEYIRVDAANSYNLSGEPQPNQL